MFLSARWTKTEVAQRRSKVEMREINRARYFSAGILSDEREKAKRNDLYVIEDEARKLRK